MQTTGLSRKVGLTILIILTVLLLILSVIIAIRLQGDQIPPDDSVACTGASNCSVTCANGSSFSDPCPGEGSFASCSQWAEEACATVGSTPGGGTQPQPQPPTGSCTPNKNAGDICTPSCGDNACDGGGPLGCNLCSNGSYRCTLNPDINRDAYDAACGNTTTLPTTCCSGAPTNPICFGEATGANTTSNGQNYRCNFLSANGSCAECSATLVGGTGSPSTPTTPDSGSGAQSCGSGTWQYSGNCIQVLTGTCNIHRFNGPNDPGQGLGCPTTADDGGTVASGPGTYCPTPSAGSCQQVDVQGSGQGVCSCTAASSATTIPSSSTTTTTEVSSSESTTTSTEALPDTALVSESFDRVLIGISLLFLGALVYKFELVERGMNYMQTQGENLRKALDFETKRRHKSREQFEERFDDEN